MTLGTNMVSVTETSHLAFTERLRRSVCTHVTTVAEIYVLPNHQTMDEIKILKERAS